MTGNDTFNYTVIQKSLNKLGADPQLKLTGIWDAQTTDAIKAFQKAHNLNQDGVVGVFTGTMLARELNPLGILVPLALVLDCTDWDQPSGGWTMPKNVGAYRFFYQDMFPGGGIGAVSENNQQLSCGHVQVPADPLVLAWLDLQCKAIRASDPAGNYFALLIRGLTLGNDALSPLEYEQQVLDKYKIESQIVSEGLFAHDSQGTNLAIAYNKALLKKKIMLIGHSMGGDEIVPIALDLSRRFVL